MNARVVACPQCGKPVVWESSNKFRPFCSERCGALAQAVSTAAAIVVAIMRFTIVSLKSYRCLLSPGYSDWPA